MCWGTLNCPCPWVLAVAGAAGMPCLGGFWRQSPSCSVRFGTGSNFRGVTDDPATPFSIRACTQTPPQSSPRLCVRHTPHGITSTPVDHEQMPCAGQPGCTSGWLKPNPSSPPVTKPQKVWISRLSQKIMGGAPLNQAQATVRDMGWQCGIQAGFVAKRSNPRQPKGQNHAQRCPRIRPVGRPQLHP